MYIKYLVFTEGPLSKMISCYLTPILYSSLYVTSQLCAQQKQDAVNTGISSGSSSQLVTNAMTMLRSGACLWVSSQRRFVKHSPDSAGPTELNHDNGISSQPLLTNRKAPQSDDHSTGLQNWEWKGHVGSECCCCYATQVTENRQEAHQHQYRHSMCLPWL